MIKQVIILRTDLNMRKGKMCAQAAHASMKVFFDRMKYFITGEFPIKDLEAARNGSKDHLRYFYELSFTYQMKVWYESSFTKIVVGVDSLEKLLDLQKQANEANIVNALITDNGNTEFKSHHCPNCNSENLSVFKREDVIANYPYFEEAYRCMDCQHEFSLASVIIKNKPTITCLAIGPDEAEKIDKITKELELL